VSGTNHFLRALVRRPRIAVAFGPPFRPPPKPLDDASARRDAYAEVGRAWFDAVTALESRRRGERGGSRS
jgi:hypothetical protein